ncbi:unnamed protein product [Pleuronectes platessa]|uniref:Uncharacterized protein n=1 Tax=Pleuronectes platessa TaxID=8262 RepID=A0A9N7VJJ2_PLEPL|nr:unnamed protein product [Pleuronectes platessa]
MEEVENRFSMAFPLTFTSRRRTVTKLNPMFGRGVPQSALEFGCTANAGMRTPFSSLPPPPSLSPQSGLTVLQLGRYYMYGLSVASPQALTHTEERPWFFQQLDTLHFI